jgi:hypothetical protein
VGPGFAGRGEQLVVAALVNGVTLKQFSEHVSTSIRSPVCHRRGVCRARRARDEGRPVPGSRCARTWRCAKSSGKLASGLRFTDRGRQLSANGDFGAHKIP